MKFLAILRSGVLRTHPLPRLAACCLFAVFTLMWAAAAHAQGGPPPWPPVRPLPTQSMADNLSDNWMINGNGWAGSLSVSQTPFGGSVQGTMYGDRVVGYFANVERTMVLVRYSSASLRPMQAFVGSVSPDGRAWSGRFHGLDVNWSGASDWGNTWAFTATRATTSAPPTPPAVMPGASGAPYLAPAFTFYNRPQEFGVGWPGPLKVTLGGLASPGEGQIDGTLFGDEFIGTYARHTGAVAFLRMSGGQPAQLYVGRAGSPANFDEVFEMSGVFYPLTEGMGADPSRLTFDWRASQGCEFVIC